jgi:hypothetical protein
MGEWYPYKNEPCDIIEIPNIPLFMKLNVCLYPDKVIFFKDTVYKPIYHLYREDLFFLCPINLKKLGITSDSINILTVHTTTRDSIGYPSMNFIISGNNLIIEDGLGVMFFLERKKQVRK